MSEALDNQLGEYVSQLAAVEESLKNAHGDQLTDLLDLKAKLQEVISLLQDSQDSNSSSSYTKVPNDSSANQSMDDEFARFQMEINELDKSGNKQNVDSDSSSDDSFAEQNQQLSEVLASLEGNKCRAPFSQPWGEKGYHNAMIVSADCDPDSLQTMEDVQVRVMFCNPVCDQMKPCSFFLNGHCKFSDERCRFSHGHKVNFSELQEFILPDFSNLKMDTKCLAKDKDDLWQVATVEKCLESQKYIVKYDRTGKTTTLDAHNILPLGESCSNNSSEEEEEEESFSCTENRYTTVTDTCDNEPKAEASNFLLDTPSSATWEQHTKGIGSRLMEKMGHVWGQGLGKNSDGRLEPVEAVILPAGKSLDKCIEMRDQCNPKGPVAVETRLGLEQDKEEQRAKKIKVSVNERKNKNIFDFINSKVSKVPSDGSSLNIRKEQTNSNSEVEASNKNLNLQIFTVGEDIKKTKREISRLQQSLLRNSDRNEVVRSKVEKKIAVQNDILRRLQAKERSITESINSQTGHKKLTVF